MDNRFSYHTEEGLHLRFSENPDGSLTLLSCSRMPKGRMPDTLRIHDRVGDRPVRRIAPLAFAPFHMEEERFYRLFHAPYSFNMFLLMNGGWLTREKEEGGGVARKIYLPDSVEEIGSYAFWHCHGTEEIRIPEGIKTIGPGTFGECADLKKVFLPESLEVLGLCRAESEDGPFSFTGEMVRGMPDVGAFFGCHSLKKLTLPSGLRVLGPHTFNSCGIEHLILKKGRGPEKEEKPLIAENAFDHAVSLLWMERQDRKGRGISRIGLPAARDKILLADRKFGRLKHVPEEFFSGDVSGFDALAKDAFRMDFAARMALSRLSFPERLSDENAMWYRDLLTQHFDQAPLFMPDHLPGSEDSRDQDPWERLFSFLKENGSLRAEDVTALIRICGELPVSTRLMDEMIAYRTEGFASATGFEDLDI